MSSDTSLAEPPREGLRSYKEGALDIGGILAQALEIDDKGGDGIDFHSTLESILRIKDFNEGSQVMLDKLVEALSTENNTSMRAHAAEIISAYCNARHTSESDLTLDLNQARFSNDHIGFRNSTNLTVLGDPGHHSFRGMTGGRVIVKNKAGNCAAIGITGGEITYLNGAGDNLAEGQKGGKVISGGSLGNYAGKNKTDGEIIIHEGSASSHINYGARGGSTKVMGSAGDHAGPYMRAGTLEIRGNAGGYAGDHMNEGTGEIMIGGSSGEFTGDKAGGGSLCVEGHAASMGKIKQPSSARIKIAGKYIVVNGDVPGWINSWRNNKLSAGDKHGWRYT